MANPEQGKKGASAIESSDLTRRLIQRATGNAGVVDVRHPQQLFSRTAAWVRKPFPLIEHLSARYAVEEQAPASTSELVVGRPPVSQLNAFTVDESPAAHRPLTRAELTAPRSASDSNASASAPQIKLRVRRSAPHTEPNSDQSASTVGTMSSDSARLAVDSQAGRDSAPTVASTTPLVLARKAVESSRESTTVASVPPAVDSRNRDIAVQTDGTPSIGPVRDPQETKPTMLSSIDPASLILAERPPTSTREKPAVTPGFSDREAGPSVSDATRIDLETPVTVDRRPTSDTHAGRVDFGAAFPLTTPELILRKTSFETSGETEAEVGAIAVTDAAPRTHSSGDLGIEPVKIMQSANASPLPLAGVQAGSSPIQRKANTAGPAAKEDESARGGVPGAPVAKEIADHQPRPSRPNIIWRKSESAAKDSRLDIIAGSAPLVVSRQTDATSSVIARAPADPTAVPSPASDQPQTVGNNLELTEQVIRALYRRLAVERERRGIE